MMKLFLTNNFFIHGVILVAGIIAAYLYLPMIALWFFGYSFYGTYKLWQKLFAHYKNKIVLFVGGLVLAATALIAAQFSGALFLGLGFVYYHDINPQSITEVSPDGKNAAVLGATYHPICKKRQYSNLHDHPKGRKIIQLPNEMGGRSMNNKQLPGEKYGM